MSFDKPLLRGALVSVLAFGGFALAAAGPAGAAPHVRSAARSAPAAHSTAAGPARPIYFAWDFRVPGVRIFAGPTPDSPVTGLGYPGQGFNGPGGYPGPDYQCDNGEVSHTWEQGSDQATGVQGWVPICNLVGE